MKNFAALLLFGFLCACSSNAGNNARNTASPGASPAATTEKAAAAKAVVLHPSTMTFKETDAECAGTLGSITFAAGHARAHAAAGVNLVEQPETHGVANMTFTDKAKGKSATVIANGHDRSVLAKNVTVKRNRSVACIAPD